MSRGREDGRSPPKKKLCSEPEPPVVTLSSESDVIEISDDEVEVPLPVCKTARITKDAINVGDKVYAADISLKHPWREATVKHVKKRFQRWLMEVQFTPAEIWRRGRKKLKTERVVGVNCIAYHTPPRRDQIRVGVRVIARNKWDYSTDPPIANKALTSNNFFCGIVAETPHEVKNKNRVLVFFDDGYAAYCPMEDVRLSATDQYHTRSWADCHPDIQKFFQCYIREYPNIYKAKTRKNSIVSVEWNGKWWAARVLEMDSSMAKLKLLSNGCFFWLWRGSKRLYDVYAYQRHSHGRHEKRKPNVEYEGKVDVFRRPPSYKYPPKVNHICNLRCTSVFTGTRSDLVTVSPVALPLYHGWRREIKHKKSGRPIVYIAPCGVEYDNLADIQKLITRTKLCPFGIDSFDLTFVLNCLEEFEVRTDDYPKEFLEGGLIIEDISDAEERVPIRMINTFDYDPPVPIPYTVSRIPRQNVPINTDQGFLVCCDCTDDCQDKSKCACFKVTHENYKRMFPESEPHEHSYRFRRLATKFYTGVYECNTKCKCSRNCTNRVVQHGLRWRLEVFKTKTKGYAVRTLQDIPDGSFITVYTGEILTSDDANKVGRAEGDEYLANLDFIEAAESHKPGYEAYVVEPDPSMFLLDRIKAKAKGKKGRAKAKPKPKKKTVTQEYLRQLSRSYFGPDEEVYAIDAKRVGNVGRYLNHSCEPNVFVQDVFIDTHDIRFPWVALFASTFILAGTELTWDYGYEVGMAGSDKALECSCGSKNCRGKLL